MSVTTTPTVVASIPALFADRVRSTPDAIAFTYREGTGWSSLTWKQSEDRVRNLASRASSTLGVDDGDAGGDPVGDAARVDPRRPGDPGRGWRDDHDLPVQHPGRVRVRHLGLGDRPS